NIKDIALKGLLLTPKKNGTFRKRKINSFYKKNITSKGIFYDDLIQQTCYYQGLQVGSKSNLHFSCTGNDPLLVSRLLFNYEIPAQVISYTVIVPDYLSIRFAFYGDSTGIHRTVMHKNDKTIYTYEAHNREAIIFEGHSEDLAYYVPHVFALPVSYTINGTTMRLGGSLPNLFNYYNRHIRDIGMSDNSGLFRLTDSILAKTSDTMQKISQIYNWVQKNIKYVAFEEGKNGYVPRPSSKIFENRYGDCKDKANILIAMLQHAGVDSYYTWVGTRAKPYSFGQLPSPHANDHMIVSVPYKGKWYFLDATAMNLECSFPSAFIQDKEALIRLSDSTYTVQKVPVVESVKSCKMDSIFLKIEKNDLVGRGIQKTFGYMQEDYRNTLMGSMNEVSSLKKEIEIGNNKLNVSDISISSEPRDLRLDYKFTLPDYLQTFDNEMYVNLNLIRNLNNEVVDLNERHLDIAEDYKYELVQNIRLNLDKNQVVHEVPKDIAFTGNSFSFQINYSLNEGYINYYKKIVIDHLLLKKENFGEWNSMIEKLSKAYLETITIKLK
ncbi:MAG: transglutaminase-like domain-containing protein, partial [Bacteroidia bacterium]